MTTETKQPVEVVEAFFAAMAKLDYATALALVSDDCEYTNVPISTVHGPAGIRSVLEPFFAPTLENEFVLKTILADGDRVFVERLDRHRLPKGWVELPVAGVLEMRGGRIVAWREYFDLATIERGFAQHA